MTRRMGLAALCLAALILPADAAPPVPGWSLATTYPDTGGRAPVAPGGRVLPPGSSPASVLAGCSGDIAKTCVGRSGLYAARACLTENKARLSRRCLVDLAALPPSSVPSCSRAPVCDNLLGPTREQLRRVLWDQTMGYTYAYPFDLPMGAAAPRAWPSIHAAISGCCSAPRRASRSCSNSTATITWCAPCPMR